jgi:hypothetical protein
MEDKQLNITNMNTTTTRRRMLAALGASAGLALLPAIANAHGGEEHVIGTVASVSPTSITVKTRAGKMVEVGLDAKTEFARTKQPIQKTDVKVGDRIVIHAREVNEKLVAHTVEIGAAPTVKH